MDEAETHLAARGRVYLTETKETWRRLERFGRDDEADDPLGRDLRRLGRDLRRLGRNDRDYGNLADGNPYRGELGRRPTPIIVNAQTKISEVNSSLRIR